MPERLEPKLITIFRERYSRSQLIADLIAGLIVGIVALPLAIAFAIASGVKPEQGLYTAIVAGIVAAMLGGSRVQVTGPTGAFIVVVYEIVLNHGYEGLATATFLAGLMLVTLGLLGFGGLLKFVPYPLTIGFTSGIALIILSSQVKDFFGLRLDEVPSEFVAKWGAFLSTFHTANPWAVTIGLLSLAVIVFSRRAIPNIPGSLLAIVGATIIVQIFKLPVETVGSRFGTVPSTLPAPRLVNLDWETVHEMFRPAMTIALLGGIESLLSAVVADGMLGTRHRSNMELVAQGVANVLSPIFQGIPATGAIARTATNVKSGGRTPIAAITHAFVLLAIMLCFGKLAALIPMPALAAILVYVAYNMSEWSAFVRALKYPRSDVAVLLVTFFLTVLIDLTVAIEVGIVLSALLFVRRMESTAGVELLTDELRRLDKASEDGDEPDFYRSAVPEGVEVFEAYGPMFFSAVDRFTNTLARFNRRPKALIIYIPRVAALDGSGIRALERIHERAVRESCLLLIAGANGQPLAALLKSEALPDEHIVSGLSEAIDLARAHLDRIQSAT